MPGAQGCCRGGARGWGAGREGHWGGLPPRAGVYVVFSLGGVGHWAPNLHLRLTLLARCKHEFMFYCVRKLCLF